VLALKLCVPNYSVGVFTQQGTPKANQTQVVANKTFIKHAKMGLEYMDILSALTFKFGCSFFLVFDLRTEGI
jgi:hypothetical protein